MNKFLNISVGVLGTLYFLNDICFRIMVNLYQQQGYTIQKANKIANIVDVVPIVIVITLLLILVGLFALISNMIFFADGNFILRVVMNICCILMPFLYNSRIWFLFYEILACILFFVYLYVLGSRYDNVGLDSF